MALSVSIVKRTGIVPSGRCVIADVTFDSAYPAGGEPYTPAMFGLDKIDFIACENAFGSSTTAYNVRADHANAKLLLYGSNTAASAHVETGVTNQAATVVRVMAFELPNI